MKLVTSGRWNVLAVKTLKEVRRSASMPVAQIDVAAQEASVALPVVNQPKIQFPSHEFDDATAAFKHKTNLELLRGWAVLSTCEITPVVNNAELLLNLSAKVFGKKLVNSIVRPTFFSHFCGGESEAQVQKAVDRLRAANVSPLLVYSAEAPHGVSSAAHEVVFKQENFNFVMKQMASVNVCFPKGISPVKPSSLAEGSALKNLADVFFNANVTPTSLSDDTSDIAIDNLVSKMTSDFIIEADKLEFLTNVWKDVAKIAVDEETLSSVAKTSFPMFSYFFDIGKKADELDQGILIDAEYYAFQPAIDFMALHLQKTFNVGDKVRFYNTFQCYLKETDAKVDAFMAIAERENFNFGAKIVRGAYMVHERHEAELRKVESPVHETIDDTHSCFNRNSFKILNKIKASPDTKVVFATHNKDSVERVLQWFSDLEFTAQEKTSVYFAQLYGMADNLTFVLGDKNVQAMKLVPYGPVSEVMPYLLRRAQENSSLLGSAKKEKKMMFQELSNRLFR